MRRRREHDQTHSKLARDLGAVLKAQYEALPVPRSDLLDDLMERLEAESSRPPRQLH
jgi:hypothetical protein